MATGVGAEMDSGVAGMGTFADLFCGIGGFHYAAASLGLRCVFACDIDEGCRAQYRHLFGVAPHGDIRALPAGQVPDHDLLFAGFPCQPFSIIGDMKGTDDDRGTLFHEILRVLQAKRPRAVALENVRQLATLGGGAVLRQVLHGLESIGYACDWKILNALDYGLPQKRERIIIVGFIDDSLARFQWPKPVAQRQPLAEILESAPSARHYASAKIRQKRAKVHQADEQPAIWHENKAGNISSYPYSCALRASASYNYLLVDGERRLTPREQLRLQGFPDSFDILGSDSQVRKQAGNAVPVPMVRAVIKQILRALGQAPARPLYAERPRESSAQLA